VRERTPVGDAAVRLLVTARRWARGNGPARRVGVPLVALAERVRTRGLTGEERWRQRLPAELAFWRDWMADPGSADDRRLDPQAGVWDPLLLRCLALADADPVEILDVGAGPFTVVGCRHPGKVLAVTAVDPLGAEYARLIAASGLVAPVPTGTCAGEQLRTHFGDRRFDVVHARNALDHSFDPGLCIREMVAVTRIGGHVALKHHVREAESQHYHGLHQHNFDVRDGALVIGGRHAEATIDEICPGALAHEHVSVAGGWVEYLGRRIA
jgi:SAM-dependent methyltransferase